MENVRKDRGESSKVYSEEEKDGAAAAVAVVVHSDLPLRLLRLLRMDLTHCCNWRVT